MVRLRIVWNQDFEEGFEPIRVLVAMELRMFPGRWHIMLNKDNWRRWSKAEQGREPARKKITHCGVRSRRFISLVVVADYVHLMLGQHQGGESR